MEVVNTSSTVDPVYIFNYVNTMLMNPVVIVALIVLLVFMVMVGANTSTNTGFSSSSSSSSSYSSVLGGVLLAVLVLLISVNALQYFFSINVSAFISGLFSPQTNVDIVVDQTSYQPAPVPEIKYKKQVFNVPGNYYTYDNAKALCAAYGAKLATYDQVEQAYNSGAEWCNYGWSENQLALFPTQKNTYETLQKTPGHEHNCGRPGVNGGYIANPNVKFGVNCYGYKPKMTSDEEELMKTATPYPETAEDLAFQKKVDVMKTKLDEILVSPFNYSSWSG